MSADTLDALKAENEKMTKSIESMNDKMDEILKQHKPPGHRTEGGSVLSSEPLSISRLLKALYFKTKNGADSDWKKYAKNDLAVTSRIQKESNAIHSGSQISEFCFPLSTRLMPTSWKDEGVSGGENIPGYSSELIKELDQHSAAQGQIGFDPDEAASLGCDLGRLKRLIKADDQRFDTATLGGFLAGPAGRGELIELLRPSLLFGQAPGIRFVPLGPSGSYEYPRHTGATTISATTEGQTIPKSNVTFGMLKMDAKQYSGLAQYTMQMMMFAGNPMIEQFLRLDMTQSAAETIDLDMMIGQGGMKILGILNTPGRLSHDAATSGANGDTLGTSDPSAMVMEIRMQNVPGEVYFGVAPNLWHAITTRKDAVGQPVFTWYGSNGIGPTTLHGTPALFSTNIPQNRVKASGTDLTFLIAFVPSQLMIGQAGVVDFSVTDSHEDNFARGISTMKMTTFTDLGVRHPQGINVCDQLVVQ